MAFCPGCGAPVAGTGSVAQQGEGVYTPESGFERLTKDPKAQEYWGRRLVAFLIDSAIVAVAVTVVAILAYLPSVMGSMLASPLLSFGLLGLGTFPLVAGLLMLLYFTVSDNIYGWTLGKRLMNLKVATKDGHLPSLTQAFIRNVSKVYWLLLLLDVVVGLALEVDYKQKYSDKFAGTLVVFK
jgi:uncharacterized RDD family membrane protein YckC